MLNLYLHLVVIIMLYRHPIRIVSKAFCLLLYMVLNIIPVVEETSSSTCKSYNSDACASREATLNIAGAVNG